MSAPYWIVEIKATLQGVGKHQYKQGAEDNSVNVGRYNWMPVTGDNELPLYVQAETELAALGAVLDMTEIQDEYSRNGDEVIGLSIKATEVPTEANYRVVHETGDSADYPAMYYRVDPYY